MCVPVIMRAGHLQKFPVFSLLKIPPSASVALLPATGRLASNTATTTGCLEAAGSPFPGWESTRLCTNSCRTGARSGFYRSKRKKHREHGSIESESWEE